MGLWINVYENVLDCPKTRDFMKKSGLSRNEAVGTLVTLWIWGIKNAEPSGLIKCADRQDVADVISDRSGLTENVDPAMVVDSMVAAGWIDEKKDAIYLHDWDEWQERYYKYEEKKKKDTERKRQYRRDMRASADTSSPSSTPLSPPPESQPKQETKGPDETPKPKKSEKAGPKKEKYGEFVSMTQAEYQKLVESYGSAAAKKAVEILDNYKGSSGKKYKSDYRAILMWVIDKIKEEQPNLISEKPPETPRGRSDSTYPEEWSGIRRGES